MRQVPKLNYLIIGNGRLAHHLSHYFNCKQILYKTWNREHNHLEDLKALISSSDYTLLCMSDKSIVDFFLANKQWGSQFIHFSGALHSSEILGFHPLMTFDQAIYSQEVYESIPFIGTESLQRFNEVFPQLANSYVQILPEQKNLYHSLCVLSGNGTTLLWDLVFKEFEKIGLKKEVLFPYLKQVVNNTLTATHGRHTGPWYRQDQMTIDKHLQELNHSPLKNLYVDFRQLSQNLENL